MAATREERSRKMAIGKENAQLARQAELTKYVRGREELIAYHEAGHAVVHEVLSNGVVEATIIPQDESKDSNSEDKGFSLGHVNPYPNRFPIPEYQRNLYDVVGSLAGGMAVDAIYDLDDEDDGTAGDEKNIEKVIKSMNLDGAEEMKFRREAWLLGAQLLHDSKILAAVEEVKELLTYKTIPGDVVRVIVKKQYRPDLFPLTITKQLPFHYRKDFFTSYFGSASYSLGIGDNHWGFTLSSPQYVADFLKENKEKAEKQSVQEEVVIDLDPGVIDLELPAVQLKLPLPEAAPIRGRRRAPKAAPVIDLDEGVIDFGVIDLEPVDLKPRSNRSR